MKEVQKSSYVYLLELRDKLEETCCTARASLTKCYTEAQASYKKYYHKKSQKRVLQVGQKALVLFSNDTNKLTMSWKGPFGVKRTSDLDYELEIGEKRKVFHINMLKRREVRHQEHAEEVVGMVITESEAESPYKAEIPTYSSKKQ